MAPTFSSATAFRTSRARSRACRRPRTGRSTTPPPRLDVDHPSVAVLVRSPPRARVFCPQISATFKIALGLVQCLSTLRSFSKVRWPDAFVVLIEAIDLFLIEAFSVVPAECIVNQRLGFFYELIATLSLPLFTFIIIMLMALLLYGCELHSVRRSKCATTLEPRVV